MIISAVELMVPTAEGVRVTDDTLSVELSDGRTIAVPIGWFPRLAHSTRRERGQWRLIERGRGIHWPLIDEDVSVEGLLAGRPSGESQESFKKWLSSRSRRLMRHAMKSTIPIKQLRRQGADVRKVRRDRTLPRGD
jgi:hypothetical protein